MSETHVAHDGTNHVCYVTTTGRDRDYLGCGHRTPREAIDHAPASRSAVEPLAHPSGGQPRQSEALDHATAQRLDMGFPDGSDGSGTASLPVASHQATSMSGTFGL